MPYANKIKKIEYDKRRYSKNRKKIKEKVRDWCVNNPEKRRKIAQEWIVRNPDKRKDVARKYAEMSRIKISDSYIKQILKKIGIQSPYPVWLMDAKRQQIFMKRTLKEIKKWRNEHESNCTDVYGE